MFLIMSAAYVDNELQSEFGRIPPSFLPLGNRRLFQHQIKLAPQDVSIYLTVPEDYIISTTDKKWLDSYNVNILEIPTGLKLGESLVASLNLSSHSFEAPLHILFGDTLFHQLPEGENVMGISDVIGNYNWASSVNDDLKWLEINNSADISESIINGYFKINSPRELIRCITIARWNLFKGLGLYNDIIRIKPIKLDDWLDFGHVNTYYKSKANFTTQRAFNELVITPDWIEKKSIKNNKILAEANWFATLPDSLALFTPQYLGSNNHNEQTSYKLEYLYQTALNELYVFSNLPEHVWQRILEKCIHFLKACQAEGVITGSNSNTLSELFGQKTITRLLVYCESRNIDMDEQWFFNSNFKASLNDILKLSNNHLPEMIDVQSLSVMHGDFCFSNILYDFRTNRIKVIDPRGMLLNGEHTIYGDIRYDIAKMSHSIIGLYDWILAGYFEVKIIDREIHLDIETISQQKSIQDKYIKLIESEFEITELSLIAMQIQLFLSMLPLHSDDRCRQDALFANAFRLYGIMKGLS